MHDRVAFKNHIHVNHLWYIGYYEEVYDLSPWCTPAILKFAKDNDFEIKDVYGDGNCLFRAVADQFMINGCPGHTEVSLRETAIE